jgi:hypothetical protein
MPIYIRNNELKGDVTVEGHTAATVSDPEYKYVSIRRYDLAEQAADGLVPDGAEAPGGGGTVDDVVVDGRIITGDAAISGGTTVLAWARVDGQGDVSGDGKSDIVVGTGGSGAHVKSLEGGDNGDLAFLQLAPVGALPTGDASDVAWMDAAWRPAEQDDTPTELQGPFDDLAAPLSGGSAAGPYYTGSVTVSSDDF